MELENNIEQEINELTGLYARIENKVQGSKFYANGDDASKLFQIGDKLMSLSEHLEAGLKVLQPYL